MVFDLSVAFTLSLEQVFHMGLRVLDRQTTLQTRFTFFSIIAVLVRERQLKQFFILAILCIKIFLLVCSVFMIQ